MLQSVVLLIRYLLLGDRVVDMNSVPVDGFTRHQATELLKNSVPTATFVLERYKQVSELWLNEYTFQTFLRHVY